ncbi:hypothetical protein NPIL_450341, partial [Nephila pilipes]
CIPFLYNKFVSSTSPIEEGKPLLDSSSGPRYDCPRYVSISISTHPNEIRDY